MQNSIPPKLKELSQKKLEYLVNNFFASNNGLMKKADLEAYNFISFYQESRQDEFYILLARKYLVGTEREDYGLEKWLKEMQEYKKESK
ncbi:hypothetical protein KY334_08095 [Candidatus Woesearchaeota archaeon]|nr:hypothetical protein [Candidatus Woesearchaeota archaeon]